MAAPTNVRVESNSVTSNRLDWSYAGAASIAVYRALHGGAFTEITDVLTRLPAATLTYIDTTPAAGVFYDYKLSDDAGSTFSSVVSVVTQVCPGTSGSTQSTNAPGLPQFVSEDDVNAQNLQQLSQQVETTLGTQVLNPQDCIACPENGAVVINCDDSCFNFTVILDQDVNSFSINGCNQGNINLIVPPNTTRKVCGFPAGFGFTGDECFNAPIVAGAAGRTVTLGMGNGAAKLVGSKSGYGAMSPGGGSGGGGGCTCTPTLPNRLTIKSCNPNNSLKCSTTKSLNLIACGGREPYTWSKTGTVNLNKAAGRYVTVTPPANAGAAVAGLAFTKAICGVDGGHPHVGGVTWASFSCGDGWQSCSGSTGGATDAIAWLDSVNACSAHSGHVVTNCTSVAVSCGCNGAPGTECATAQSCGAVQDRRTAPMIAAGCTPCSVSEGSTVTVTDAAGASVTIILKA